MRTTQQKCMAHAVGASFDCRVADNAVWIGAAVRQIPIMIRQNGLLASAAFACGRPSDYEFVFEKIIDYLGADCSLPVFLELLSRQDSSELRHTTEECLEYLGLLRQLV